MAKTNRLKRPAETARAPADRSEAETMLARLGAIRRELALSGAALEETVGGLKAQAEEAAKPLAAEAEMLLRGLQLYAEANRAALTDGGRTKTVKLSTGELVWRLRPPSVRLRDLAAVIETIQQLGLTKFLRTKHEVNKEALLAAPGEASAIPGVSIGSPGEEFAAEPLAMELVASRAV